MKTKKGKEDWRIASEIELIYKTKVKASERPQITSSKATYKLALQSWNPNKIEFLEQFKVLLLNKANRVLGIYEMSTGGITATTVDLRLLFTAALKAKATAIIMLHNHPSGKALPSPADKVMTKKVKDAGIILDIEVVDHLIITPESYYSFADNGIM
ncbi:JAB domain-containing protein [Flavobacterium tructae]|uniref:DNA repair protein n=1 Tax=Flavobacterium tructae TaxID=1114873 RepID=A0A1S1J413_9FLAO|nr:JAB domain-containing protein [Flavobacterium tructae]OHT45397.1 DNA repair protein [Flavobacterium tructae]OXB18056.1 DNA repair protein [Flavobacterium tructae]